MRRDTNSMNKSDFAFDHKDEQHQDYWFKVSVETQKQLTDHYMEQSMVAVTEVVFCPPEDVVGVKCLFPFNYIVVDGSDNDALKNVLKSLVRDVDGGSQ